MTDSSICLSDHPKPSADMQDKQQQSTRNIQVLFRVRPLLKNETEFSWDIDDNSGQIQLLPTFQKNDTKQQFKFNKIYDEQSSNNDVFEGSIKPVLPQLLRNCSCTVMCYGQSSSGKTSTMFQGPKGSKGLVQLIVDELFELVSGTDFIVKLQYLEIYNEVLIDLLSSEGKQPVLREEGGQTIMSNVTEPRLTSHEELVQWICQGNKRRTVSETNLNEQSSRSHAIIRLVLQQGEKLNLPTKKAIKVTQQSCFTLVDLAGSERIQKSNTQGKNFKESNNINRSLMTLGLVINQLSNKSTYISYRDSKLTRLLQNSLGGNAVTFIIGCISPASKNIDESISTMRFCERAMKIQNKLVRSLVGPIQVTNSAQRQEELVMQNRALKQRVQELEKQLSLTQSQCMVQSTCSSFISDTGELNINELDQYLNDQQTDVRSEKQVQTETNTVIQVKEIIKDEDLVDDEHQLFDNEEFKRIKAENYELNNKCKQLHIENEDLKKKSAENEMAAFQSEKQLEQLKILQQQEEQERQNVIKKLQYVEEALKEKHIQAVELESEKHRLDNLLEELIKQTGDSSEQQAQYQEQIKQYEDLLAQKAQEQQNLVSKTNTLKESYEKQLFEAKKQVENMQQRIQSIESELQAKMEQEIFFTQLLEETEAQQKVLQDEMSKKVQNNKQMNAELKELQEKYAETQEVLQRKEEELRQQEIAGTSQKEFISCEINNIKQEQAFKQQEIIKLQQKASEFQEELQRHNTTINVQKEEINTLQDHLTEKEEKLQKLQTILDKLQTDILERQQNITDKSVQLSQILTCSKALETSHAQLLSKCLQNSVIYGCDVSIQKSIIKYNKNVNTSQQVQEYNMCNNEETCTLSKISSAKISLKSQFSSVNEEGEAISVQQQQFNSIKNLINSSGSLSKRSPLQKVYVNTNNDDSDFEQSIIKYKASISGDVTCINGYTTKVKESLTMKDLTRSNSGESIPQNDNKQQNASIISSGAFALQSNVSVQNNGSSTNITAATTQPPSIYSQNQQLCQSTHLLCAKTTVVQDNALTRVSMMSTIVNANTNVVQASNVLKSGAYVQKTQIPQQDFSASGIQQEEKSCQRTPLTQNTISNQTINFLKDKQQQMTPKIYVPNEIQTDSIQMQNQTQTSPHAVPDSVTINIQTSPTNKDNCMQMTLRIIDTKDTEVQLQFNTEKSIQTENVAVQMCDNACQNINYLVDNNSQVTPQVIQDQTTTITPVCFQENQMQCESSQPNDAEAQTDKIELKEFDFPLDQQLKETLDSISSNLTAFSTKAKRPGLLKGKQQDASSVTSYNFTQLVKTLNKLIDVFAREYEQKENLKIQAETQEKIQQLEQQLAQMHESNTKLLRKSQLYQQEIEQIHQSYQEQLRLKNEMYEQQKMQLLQHDQANYTLTKNIDTLMGRLHQEEEKTQRLQESALEEQLEMTQKILSITNVHSEQDTSETELVYSSAAGSQEKDETDYKKLYEETEAKFNRLLQQSRETIQKVMTVAKERETNLQRKAAEQVQNMQKYKEIVMRMQMRAKQQQQTMQFQQQLINEQINKQNVNEIMQQ